ncbi:mucin-2-like isoform X2 [Ylistrum balloti]|uniref:mucin-2-like isoform X2 n=1 Tax=Ylistrum balloti TaxID=509963 RepID=UPI0029058F89|nr:mucin-2-like isoform X2 [Ylistrum balloti]
MASKQPDDKGPRTNTNQDKNHIPRGTLENPMSPFQRSNISKNGQTRGRHNDELEYDAVMDSGPTTHSQAYEFQDQIPNLVDVVVIYSNEDFDLVKTKFVPWLTDLAREAEDILSDPTIHLYDDYDIFPQVNVHRQTEEVSAKCMKILVFITDNLMKNEKLKHLVEELIELTKFMDKDEARNHIAKISGLTSNQKIVEYLFDCILRQRGNAIIPVQTKAEKIGFTGLRSIRSIQFYDLTENPRFKEYVATGVIKAAIKERKLQKNVVGHMKRSQNRDINDCPNNSSRKQAHATTVHKNRNQNQGSAARVISNSASDNPVENQLNNEAILSTGPSNDCITGPSTDRITGPSPDRTSGPSTYRTTGPSTDRTTGPPTDRIAGSSSDHITGASTDRITGPSTDHFTRPSTSSDVPANQTNGIQSDVPHPSEVWKKETEEVNTVVISEEIPADGATAASSNENTIHDDSLETDRVKSAMDKSEDGKIISSKLSESEESKSENDSAETSLDNTGLVNDSGDAALRSSNLDHSKESMLSIDVGKVEGETFIKNEMMMDTTDRGSKVIENILTHSGVPDPFARGVMAGIPCAEGLAGEHSVGKSNSTAHVPEEPPPGYFQGLYPFLTGLNSDKMPVLNIVHHHLYQKSDPQPPAQPSKPEKPSTINVYGANTVMIGKHSHAIMTETAVISKDHLKSNEPDDPTTPQETNEKESYSGSESSRSISTSSEETLSSPPHQLNTLNFPEPAKQNKEWRTDDQNDDKNNSVQPTAKMETTNDFSSSDEDNSFEHSSSVSTDEHSPLKDSCPVSTQGATGGGSKSKLEERKETNLKDIEELNIPISTTKDDISGYSNDQTWQADVEAILGSSLTTDLESLVASETLGKRVDTETSTHVREHLVHNEESQAELQTRVREGQTTYLFGSVLAHKQQFHLFQSAFRPNPVGMMAQCPVLSQGENINHNDQDDDLD